MPYSRAEVLVGALLFGADLYAPGMVIDVYVAIQQSNSKRTIFGGVLHTHMAGLNLETALRCVENAIESHMPNSTGPLIYLCRLGQRTGTIRTRLHTYMAPCVAMPKNVELTKMSFISSRTECSRFL